jgi:3-deoxy-manno-octulosonate cytidylyltransferase (CMP-KDO synthetase)
MKILGIIPARYKSSRFPGKPLVDIKGKTMIQRVYERCVQARNIFKVVVATDDERIVEEVTSFGGEVMMTSEEHQNGTERCSEIAHHLPADAYINIQGDEPFIHPDQIDQVAQLLKTNAELATLIKKIEDPSLLALNSVMKVVFNHQMEALYFSRNCIPYLRNYPKDQWLEYHDYWKHIGIYGYRADVLSRIVNLPASALEQAESLEQLRWLENGFTIKLGKTEHESRSIDTPRDLQDLLKDLDP